MLSLQTNILGTSPVVPSPVPRDSWPLDALRAIAALLVLLEHWRNVFFVDYSQLPSRGFALGAFYALSGAGHQAVVIFFVLSGYLISGTIFRAVSRSQWSWSQYLVRRTVRLWLVLVPALLLGMTWDSIGLHLGQAPDLYRGLVANHMATDVAQNLSPATLLGNVLFLQNIAVPALGSNAALWSLANEWWYYIMFPLGVCCVAAVYRRILPIVTCLALFCFLAWFVGASIMSMFPIWLLGAMLHFVPLPNTRRSKPFMIAACILYALVFFGSSALDHRHGRILNFTIGSTAADYLLALATFPFIWLLLSPMSSRTDSTFIRASREVSRFSYSLYVLHTPLLLLCASVLVQDSRWTPGGSRLASAIAVFVLLILYARIVAFFTEYQTDTVRRYVECGILARVQQKEA